jgi:hypothetical protein
MKSSLCSNCSFILAIFILMCGSVAGVAAGSVDDNSGPARTQPDPTAATFIAVAGAASAAEKAAEPSTTEPTSERKLKRIREANQRKAREMMARDGKIYSRKEMAELESTYQIANEKTRSPEAMEALRKVVEQFDKSNRAGCAALYLGRWSQGDDREKYLQLAIEKYSDSYYLDGTSVGGYARLVLGADYKKAGKDTKAKKLFDEIRKDYANATDHGGALLVDILAKQEW